jgi:GNAT superfamily N-acetyltransferase
MGNIKPAQLDDASAIRELISYTLRRCVVADDASYEAVYSDICTILDSWAANPEGSVHLVYECGDSIVGVVLISNFERMHLLFVHPSHQRKGIGRALVDRALEACRLSGGSTRVTLNSSNHAAAFYREYGFVPNGEPRDLPGGCIPLATDL